MQPRNVRRALTAVALGIAALSAMAACRVEQGAAVFVGDTRITEDAVNSIVDSLPVEVDAPLGGFRAMTVDALATVELGEQVAEDTGGSPDAASAEAIRSYWQSQGLPAEHEFVELMAEAEGYRAMLLSGAEPAAPTEADIEKIAAQFAENSGQPMTEADVAGLGEYLNSEAGQEIIGGRDQVAAYVAEYQVTANPRYGEGYITVARDQQRMPVVTVPLGR